MATMTQLSFNIGPYGKNVNTKNHPLNISGKFGSNLFSGFREEDLNVKS
jgi:hypothetical protein